MGAKPGFVSIQVRMHHARFRKKAGGNFGNKNARIHPRIHLIK